MNAGRPIAPNLQNFLKVMWIALQAMQESVQMDVDQHRSAVRQIVAQAPVRSVHDDSRLVSAEWLQQWVDSDPELKPVKNEALLCPHGSLSPDKPTGGACCHLLLPWRQHALPQACSYAQPALARLSIRLAQLASF